MHAGARAGSYELHLAADDAQDSDPPPRDREEGAEWRAVLGSVDVVRVLHRVHPDIDNHVGDEGKHHPDPDRRRAANLAACRADAVESPAAAGEGRARRIGELLPAHVLACDIQPVALWLPRHLHAPLVPGHCAVSHDPTGPRTRGSSGTGTYFKRIQTTTRQLRLLQCKDFCQWHSQALAWRTSHR